MLRVYVLLCNDLQRFNHNNSTEFQEFMEAFGQMGSTLFQTEKSLDERMLYQRSVRDKYTTSAVPAPLSSSACIHVSILIWLGLKLAVIRLVKQVNFAQIMPTNYATCTFGNSLTSIKIRRWTRTWPCISLSYLTQEENQLLQRGCARNSSLYSLVVSVNSTRSRLFEVYIDAYLRNTALKVNWCCSWNLPLDIDFLYRLWDYDASLKSVAMIILNST